MQNIKSKPQNIASFGVSSSAVLQSESSSTGATTEPRQLSTISSTTHSHRWTWSRSVQTLANVCDVPRRQAFGQNGIISTRIDHRASARYSSVPQITADTQTALPTVAPQTAGEGLVIPRHMTKSEEVRARALMPSNSEACWSGAPYPYH